MDLQQLVHYAERSFVWHLVGDLVRHVEPGVLLVVGGVLVLALVLARLARGVDAAGVPARQRDTASVTCACGRRWTVRT
jgi:hypothetical protein